MNTSTRSRLGTLGIALLASAVSIGTAQAIGIEDVVDGGNTYAWQEVKLAGTVCGDGSQYKFYTYDNPSSKNLVVLFEGGGACWDYASCSGQAGILGASHPNGIPDNYMAEFEPQYVSPIVNGADPGLPIVRAKKNIATSGWDVVYMPYCTGDVHLGNSVVTYTDPAGVQPPIVWRHAGYNNTKKALEYIATKFTGIQKLLVTGFSAGGSVTGAGYYLARRTLNPTVKGYMLNDSGPVFPAPNATYKSRPLHDQDAVGPLDALRVAARELRPERLRQHHEGGGDRVSERPARVHRLLERLQLLTLFVRALLPGDQPGDGAGVLAPGPGEPRHGDEEVRELQLSHSVAPADQREPLLVDHHLHWEPRLPDGEEEVLVRDPDWPDLEVPEREHALRDLPLQLDQLQREVADRRTGELLQQ
jgi:hypothetical protein